MGTETDEGSEFVTETRGGTMPADATDGTFKSEGWVTLVPSAAISGLGVILLPVSFSHAFSFEEPLTGVAFSLLTSLLAVGLIYGGYWLLQSDLDREQHPKIAMWTLAGTILLGTVLALMVAYQHAEGAEVADAAFFVAGTVTVGAVGGFVIGLYDARRVRAEEVIREQEKVALFNQILRHNVLNATNLVRGRAELLEPHVDADGERHLETLLDWSENISELTQKVRRVIEEVSSPERETEAVELSGVLDRQLERIRTTYEGASIVVDGELPDEVYVEADDMLEEVFENVFTNAIEHNDEADTPEVRVSVAQTGDSVVTTIADNGPGIPDHLKDDVFGRTREGIDETGVGIGLYLVDRLVDQYGGDIWIEDVEPTGSAFKIELQRAAEGP